MPNFFQRIFNFRNKSDAEVVFREGDMTAIQERIQRAAESLYENESLTTDLDDETAKVLLDWGVERAEAIASETVELDEVQAEDAMYQPMRTLRKMLRIANKWARDPQERDLGRILQQAELVYGYTPDEEEQTVFLEALPGDMVGRVRALHNFLAGENQDLDEV